MDTVCHNLQFTFVYIDDILVASPDNQTHKEHLRLLFQWLQQYSLVINVAKCQFGCNNIDFLGHCISHAGTAPLPDKVEAITQMQPPETTKRLQEFVGMVNFYRRFIPSVAHIMLLFNALANKQKSLTWTEIINDLFQATKKALAGATLLAHLCQGAPTSLTMNASDHAVRVVLQSIEGVTVPLAFSAESCDLRRKIIVPLIDCCSLSILEVDTFTIFLKADSSQLLQITNPSHTAYLKLPSYGPQCSNANSPIFQNLLPTSNFCMAAKVQSQTLYSTIATFHLGIDYLTMAKDQQQNMEVQP